MLNSRKAQNVGAERIEPVWLCDHFVTTFGEADYPALRPRRAIPGDGRPPRHPMVILFGFPGRRVFRGEGVLTYKEKATGGRGARDTAATHSLQ